jgi:hypothetical protein
MAYGTVKNPPISARKQATRSLLVPTFTYYSLHIDVVFHIMTSFPTSFLRFSDAGY